MLRIVWLVTVVLLLVCSSAISQTPNTLAGGAAPASSAVTALAQAESLYRDGNYAEAQRSFEQALTPDPKSGAAYEGLVRSYLKQDMVEQAWTKAQEGLKHAPEQSQTHTAMGEALFRKGLIARAQDEFVAAHNLNSRDARARLGLMHVYRSASYYAQAKKMLEAAHRIDPQDRDIENAWMASRPRKEKIEALEQRLTKEKDQKERESTQRYLEFLKAEEKEPHTCHLVNRVAETQIPLKVLMPNPNTMVGVQVKVTINGKAMNLLLDTGASGILVRQATGRKAGLAPAIEAKFGGIGDEGERIGYLSYADSIKVGELEFQKCVVMVSDTHDREGREFLSDVDGLIGADVFVSYLVSIDFPGERMTLKPLPNPPLQAAAGTANLVTADQVSEEADAAAHDRYIAPEMAKYTPFFRFRHFMLVPTQIGSLEPKLFLIDSGAFFTTISLATAREVTDLGVLHIQVRGLSGEIKKTGRAERPVVLQFGHVAQENSDLVAFDNSAQSRAAGMEISGILGYTALSFLRVDIDYRDGLVNFTYDPKKYRPLVRERSAGKWH